jgi:hypothetical protein
MVVFAGEDSDNGADGSVLNSETWTFDPGSHSWSPLLFSGTPSFRSGHSSVYDAANRRMLMFGGQIGDSPKVLSNDFWALRLDTTPAWSILNPSVPLGLKARYGHSAVYDSAKNRMVIYGGYDTVPAYFNELWVIKL